MLEKVAMELECESLLVGLNRLPGAGAGSEGRRRQLPESCTFHVC